MKKIDAWATALIVLGLLMFCLWFALPYINGK